MTLKKSETSFLRHTKKQFRCPSKQAYITPDNISQILGKAAQSARSVSVESGYMTDETKEQILQKADAQARAVAGQAKDYTPA